MINREIAVILLEALSKLDANEPTHWTSHGEPKVETVNVLCGYAHKFTKSDIKLIAPDFNVHNTALPNLDDIDFESVHSESKTEMSEISVDTKVPSNEFVTYNFELLNTVDEVIKSLNSNLDNLKDSDVSFEDLQNINSQTSNAIDALTKLQNKQMELIHLIISDVDANTRELSNKSINGYVDAQRGLSREVDVVLTKKIHAIDNPVK